MECACKAVRLAFRCLMEPTKDEGFLSVCAFIVYARLLFTF